MCKRERDEIESSKNNNDTYFENFKYHVGHTHDIWKYLHYRLYLSKKDKSDFTGTEDAIYKKISESKLDWIPSSEEDPIGNIEATLEAQSAKLSNIESLVTQIHTKMNEKPGAKEAPKEEPKESG